MNIDASRVGLRLPGVVRPSWSRLWVLLACSGALLGTLIVFNLLNNILPTADDVDLYYRYAFRTLHGELPYRDFIVEYPPFALLFFILPALLCYPFGGMNPQLYDWLFHTQAFILNLSTLWLGYSLLIKLYPAAAIRAHHTINWRLAAYTLGSMLISLYLLQRFDVGATFLTILALWFFYNKNYGWSGFALGLGAAAKLYPGILLPVILLYMWYALRNRPACWRYIAGFCLACALVLMPFLVTGSNGLRAFLAYHSDRGIQVETIFAAIIVFGSYLGLTNALAMVDHGALGLASYWVKPLATFSTVLTIAGLLFIYYLVWRDLRNNNGRVRTDWLIEVLSITVLWFILANKVLSPQYLVWMLAFMPLWRGWKKTVLFLIALPLSFIPFPFLIDWMARLDFLPYAILAVRNGLLIAIMVMLVRDIWKIPNPFRRNYEGLTSEMGTA
ncbi:MAG TPA: glycosyltransferase 87 family protein [Chloroflexia bacterium]|nr:glycosyltransferase 87 family protein [Chloroflexia bacterium]